MDRTRHFAIRFPNVMFRQIEDVARSEDLPVAGLIKLACREFLERRKRPDAGEKMTATARQSNGGLAEILS